MTEVPLTSQLMNISLQWNYITWAYQYFRELYNLSPTPTAHQDVTVAVASDAHACSAASRHCNVPPTLDDRGYCRAHWDRIINQSPQTPHCSCHHSYGAALKNLTKSRMATADIAERHEILGHRDIF